MYCKSHKHWGGIHKTFILPKTLRDSALQLNEKKLYGNSILNEYLSANVFVLHNSIRMYNYEFFFVLLIFHNIYYLSRLKIAKKKNQRNKLSNGLTKRRDHLALIFWEQLFKYEITCMLALTKKKKKQIDQL